MSTTHADDEEVDYQTNLREQGPVPEQIRTYDQRQKHMRQVGKHRINLYVDKDVIDGFKAASGGRRWQTLMADALREWLTAQSVKELVREEVSREIAELRAAVGG